MANAIADIRYIPKTYDLYYQQNNYILTVETKDGLNYRIKLSNSVNQVSCTRIYARNVYKQLYQKDLFVILEMGSPSFEFDGETLIIYNQYIMINRENYIDVYDCETFEYIKKLSTELDINRIKFTSIYIVLDCSYQIDNVIKYHYELYNYKFEHIRVVNKKIKIVNNSIDKHNVIVLTDKSLESKLDSKYMLYDCEEDSYIKIENTPINLTDYVLYCDSYNKIQLLAKEEDELECSVCFEPLKEIVVLVPCGHTRVCTTCYGSNDIQKCPMCYKVIEQRIRVYK